MKVGEKETGFHLPGKKEGISSTVSLQVFKASFPPLLSFLLGGEKMSPDGGYNLIYSARGGDR